tara:strand:+ start:127 stop:384 length:258 start_codon:yes stop_codon:yes gene_type:complete
MSTIEIIDVSSCGESINKKDTSRCQYSDCRKKIKITDYTCKCGNVYCKIHKLPEDHECNYDYREIGLKNKKIEEMKCVSNKVQKI